MAQQLAISRDLTKKLKSSISDSEDEGVDVEENVAQTKNDDSNPWISSGIKPGQDVLDFVSGYRKYWDEKNKNTTVSETKTTEEPEKQVTVKEKSPKVKKIVKNNKISKTDDKKMAETTNGEWEVESLEDIFDKLEQKLKTNAKTWLENVTVEKISKKKQKPDVKKKKIDLTLPSQSKKLLSTKN